LAIEYSSDNDYNNSGWYLYLNENKVFMLGLKKLKKLDLMECYKLKETSVLEQMDWLEELKLYGSGLSSEDCNMIKQKLSNTNVNCTTIR